MFYGEFEHSIDRKGRLIIPAKFRQTLKEDETDMLMLTRGLDGCLFLFPEPDWRGIEERFKKIPFTKTESRHFSRLFFSGASEVSIDNLGRILVPRLLIDFAQIRQDVVVVGISTRIEIWAKDRWRAFYESSRPSFEQMAERVFLDGETD